MLVTPVSFSAPAVPGLTPAEQAAFAQLVELWRTKQPRNRLRQAYLDGVVRPDNLNIAVPDDMVDQLGAVIGWPRKVVFGLSDLLIWDGVTAANGHDNPFEIDDLLASTGFELEIAQTIPSSLTHSVAFLTLRKGVEAAGEPPVIIQGHSADWAAGLWDRVRRRLSYGLTIDDIDDAGRPTRFTLYTADSTYIIELNAASAWRIVHAELHGMGAPMMEALPFEPSLDRPLGRSRISRDVMSITQRAMRTVLREELATELFTAPGILLSGVDSDLIDDLRSWDWKLGTIKTISSGEEPDGPKVTVLPQQSAQPFTEQMRALATELSGVSSLPVSSLGVIQDNPSSAEALYAAKEELVIKAKNAQRVFDAALTRVYAHAVMMRDGIDEMTPELRSLATRWGDPAHPSIVSQSDAIVKQISALPWLAESPVVLEELGYSGSQIARLMSDKRRAEASGLLDRLSAQDTTDTTVPAVQDTPAVQAAPAATGGLDTSHAKEAFDALGVAVRAGVDPQSALEVLGMSGVKLTGAVPVSLRLPEADTKALEEK
nr:MAG TPA: PORTAL PROTEIN [Caudoviricetes sp.]